MWKLTTSLKLENSWSTNNMTSASKSETRPSSRSRHRKSEFSVTDTEEQPINVPNPNMYVISDGTVINLIPGTVVEGEEIHIGEDGTFVDSQGQLIEIHEASVAHSQDHGSIGSQVVFQSPTAMDGNHYYHIITGAEGEGQVRLVKQEDEQTSDNAPLQGPAITVEQGFLRQTSVKSSRKVKNKDIMALPFTYAGQSFNVQAQKLILNVYNFFKDNSQDPYILHRLGTPLEQAGKILNISNSVVGKIRNRFEALGKIVVPGQTRKKAKRVLDTVTPEQEQAIRDMVQELSMKRIPPTVPLILNHARKRINFIGSRTSFRRVLLRMGFKYAKVKNKTIIIDPNERHRLSISE